MTCTTDTFIYYYLKPPSTCLPLPFPLWRVTTGWWKCVHIISNCSIITGYTWLAVASVSRIQVGQFQLLFIPLSMFIMVTITILSPCHWRHFQYICSRLLIVSQLWAVKREIELPNSIAFKEEASISSANPTGSGRVTFHATVAPPRSPSPAYSASSSSLSETIHLRRETATRTLKQSGPSRVPGQHHYANKSHLFLSGPGRLHGLLPAIL